MRRRGQDPDDQPYRWADTPLDGPADPWASSTARIRTASVIVSILALLVVASWAIGGALGWWEFSSTTTVPTPTTAAP